jgi:hypothetical protein
VAVQQQVDDFFETGVGGEIVDVVAAVRQASFTALDVTQLRVADDDALKAAIDNDTGGTQGLTPSNL